MFGKKSNDNGEKLYRYSIRKYHFGAASVAVAALMFFANGAVKADTLSVSPVTANTEKVTAGVTGLTEGVPPKEHPIEKSKEVEGDKTTVAQKTVDKSPLVQAISELQAAIAKVDEESLLSLANQLSQLTDENKRLLDGEDISKETLTRQVIRVQSLTEQVRQLKSKTEDKASNKEDRADSKAQDKKELKVSDKAVIPTNQNEEIKAVQKDEKKGEGTANKDKLEALSKSLISYLDTAKKIERPETKKLLEGIEEIVRSVENGLVNPQLTASEIEELMKQGKQAEKKLALAVAREHSGARDSRNGKSMGQGTGFRANGQINQGALADIRYYASVDPGTNGGNAKRNNDPEFTRNKTDIKATYVKDSEGKWIVYDVYFNNDGHKMVVSSYQQHYYFQGPFNIMDLQPGGGYKPNTVKDLSFTRYQNTGGRRLSDGGQGFTKYGNTAVITNPAYQQRSIFGSGDTFYDPNSGVTGGRNQPWEVFKHNQDEGDLNLLTKAKNGNYPGLSYYLGVDVHRDSIDYAMHMHVKIKLRDNVTSEEVAQYGRVYAASVTKAPTTNQSYIMGAMGTRLQNIPDAQLYPIQGGTYEKTVGDTLNDPTNPVGAGYITRKGGGDFPDGMRWSWRGDVKPTSTANAGIFKYKVIARYNDGTSSEDTGSGSDGTVTLKVKPKKPTIAASEVEHKKGLTGQSIRVNVGSGVKDNSIVKLYDGDRVIGRGTTHGETGTVIVQGALSGNPITAETLVNNGGEVTSVRSDAVRPTEVPDRVAPRVSINGRALTTNADENQFIIYRGAAFNPTFNVTDESRIGSLMVRNLPKGVYFNKVNNVDKELVGTSTTLNHTISDDDSNKVADDATLGEQIATVEASDQYGNSATYKFKYRIVDIQAKNSTTENRAVGSTLGNPHDHFKVAESNTVENDKYYPTNMQFKWKEFDIRNSRFTDVPDNTRLNEVGTITKYTATAVFPGVKNTKEIDRVNYTIYSPIQKAVPITFNVTDSVAPTVKMTNPTNNAESVLGSDENNLPVVEVFRGATLNIPLKMSDNNTNGKINIKHISGLPTGVNLNNGNTLSQNSGSETNPATATITGRVAANAELGTKVVTLKVSDDATGDVNKGNQATLKFKVKTYDLAFEDRGTRVDDNTRSDVLRLNETSVDPNHYLTTTDGTNRGDGNFGSDMKFRYLKGTEINEHVSFDKIGKYPVKARAYFPNSKTSTKGLPTNPSGLTGDTASVNGRGFLEKTVVFNVKPNTPTISQPQFNGTADTRPNVTVENLPTNAQLQNGATVTVELYQGTTIVASKTVTDRNGTTTLSARDFTTNLTEGQQVHAVVKVSGGQGATAYSVSSDNSENRNVTGYNLVARDIINVKRGETISADELKRFIQVQEGNQRVDLPQGATVTATLDTNSIRSGSEETKTVEATVNFGDNRTKKVRLTYKVLNTFPIANTIYDFKDVNRSNGHSDYYVNKGNNIPGGMNWLYKRSGGAEQRGTTFTGTLASDPVGTTNYTFIGRYNYGRFTNPTTTTGNLEHTQTLVHKVFDIADSKNVSVSQGTTLSAEQAKAAVKNAVGSDSLPNGTTYEWVGNKTASTSGKQTFQVKVTLPPSQTGDNLPAATQVTPSKTIDVTVNVTPPKPTFDSNKVTSTSRTITGTLGGLNANSRNTVVSVALNDGTNRVLTSENNGGVRINGNTWTATLPDDVKLRTSVAKNGETTQPRGLTVTTKIKGSTTADDISVVSDVKAVEMGDYSVNTTVAGSKHIDVKVPHDAKRMELRFHNSTETSNTPKSIVLVRSQNGGNWQVDSTATPTGVTNANNFVQTITNTVNASNKAENLVTITLKESHNNSKLRIKEENASGDNTTTYRTGLGLRVDYKPEPRQAVTSVGNWKVVSVTNNKPTLAYKGTEASSVDARKVFPSGTSITKAMLENLVTVGDTEDKVTNEADKPYGIPTIKIVSGLTETPGKATVSGSYAVVLKAVDSQGKESDPLTVYVGVVSTELKYQPQVDNKNIGDAVTIPVTGSHKQGDPISYTPSEITVGGKVYVPVAPGEQTVTLTPEAQTINVAYKEKDASTELKYQPQVDNKNIGDAVTIPVTGSHKQGDPISYTPSEITVGGKVYVPVAPGEQTVTLTPEAQTINVAYKEKDASTELKYQPQVDNKNIGDAVTIPVTGSHKQGDPISYTPSEITVGGKVYVPVAPGEQTVTLTPEAQTINVAYKEKDASTELKYQPQVDNKNIGDAVTIPVTGSHKQGDPISYTPSEITVGGKVYVPVAPGEQTVTLTPEAQTINVAYKEKDASTELKYQPQVDNKNIGDAVTIPVTGSHKQGDPISYTPSEITVGGKVYVPVAPGEQTVTLTPEAQTINVAYKEKDASTELKYQPQVDNKNIGDAVTIPVTGSHKQGDPISYTPSEITVGGKVYVPVAPGEQTVTLTPEAQTINVAYKEKDASTELKYQPQVDNKNIGDAVTIPVTGSHKQGDPISYTPSEITVGGKVYVPVAPGEQTVTLTPEAQTINVAYKEKDASTELKYQPQVDNKNIGDAVTIPVTGSHKQGDPISYTPSEITVGGKVYVPVAPGEQTVTLTPEAQTINVAYKEKDASTELKYQPQVDNKNIGDAVTIPVTGSHKQGDPISYTPSEITVGGKVYVPVAPGEQTVTLTPEAQTINVAYKEKDASTELKYQPQVDNKNIGDAVTIPVTGSHKQGDPISYTPSEITVGGKVYVPVAPGEQTVTLTPEAQTVTVEYVEKPATSTPTFTVGTQNPQTGNVEVTVDGVPEGTKVKLPGIVSKKVVTGGKVELTNNELPENPTTGKGIAQEDGKLPKEGTSDITIPGKLTSAKGEPAREFEVTIPLPIVVPDPEHLTPKEIEKLVDKVTESNPNTIVTADDKGNVTVTDKTTGDSALIPVKDLTVKDFEPVKPDEKVPVKDKAHLTPEEKKQVADKVKDKNPGKEVTVGDDGTATVTDPTTGISHTIPGTDLVNQDFDPVKPTEKVPVKDKAHLTPEEKKQVADKVKDKNPGKEVTVGDDGTATVTDPTTGISHTIPGTDLVNQDFDPVKPTEKVPVKDKAHLTPEEKKQVADKVKDKNPGKEVTVGDDGTATVTDPTTGISHTIPGTDLVNQDFDPVKPTEKVPVKDPSNLTKEEQDKVKKAVEKANPGKDVTVDSKGNATVKDPRTKISHEIPNKDLVMVTGKGDSTQLDLPSLIITKWVDENGNDLKQPDAKAPSVPGEANEAFEYGEIEGYVFVRTETKGDVVTHVFRKVSPARPTGDGQQRPATPSADTNRRPDTAIPAEVPVTQPTEQPSQTVEVPAQLANEVSETDSSVSQPQAVLPNTGTKADRATGALGFLSLLGAFGLLFSKKKKDDEEEA